MPVSFPANVANLGDIGDVDLTGLMDDDVIQFDAGTMTWLPAAGTVDISALTGGTDDEMLFRLSGVWTSSDNIWQPKVGANNRRIQVTTETQGLGTFYTSFEINALAPGFMIADIDGGTNQIRYQTIASAGVLVHRLMSTSGGGTSSYMSVSRAGTSVLNVTILAPSGGGSDPHFRCLRDAEVQLGYNGSQVFETLPAAMGGASIDNQATGGGFERVLTTSDLPGAAESTEFIFNASDFQNPNNADWTINALAPAVADSNNNGLTVRLFDDTIEEGIGFQFLVPGGASNIVIQLISRAETAPGAARTVGVNLYNRGIPDNAAVEAWSVATQLNDIDIPTNENFQYDSQTIALATLGVTAGEVTQFELTRTTPGAGTNLTGDWALLEIRISFT